jgi:hypothetical protein
MLAGQVPFWDYSPCAPRQNLLPIKSFRDEEHEHGTRADLDRTEDGSQ